MIIKGEFAGWDKSSTPHFENYTAREAAVRAARLGFPKYTVTPPPTFWGRLLKWLHG